MDLILKEGQIGLKQDLKIYGQNYQVKRDGRIIGIATFSDDPVHGDGFFIYHDNGNIEVCVVDEWEFA